MKTDDEKIDGLKRKVETLMDTISELQEELGDIHEWRDPEELQELRAIVHEFHNRDDICVCKHCHSHRSDR